MGYAAVEQLSSEIRATLKASPMPLSTASTATASHSSTWTYDRHYLHLTSLLGEAQHAADHLVLPTVAAPVCAQAEGPKAECSQQEGSHVA